MSSRSRMRGTAAAASGVLTVMRTSSEPARASSATCFAVPATSAVSVLVIDCTTTGAPPPTVTPSTRTATLARRGAGAGDSDRVIAGDNSVRALGGGAETAIIRGRGGRFPYRPEAGCGNHLQRQAVGAGCRNRL